MWVIFPIVGGDDKPVNIDFILVAPYQAIIIAELFSRDRLTISGNDVISISNPTMFDVNSVLLSTRRLILWESE